MAGVRIFVVLVLLRWIQLTSGFCASGKFGDSCGYSCRCQTPCNETTGVCTGDCDTGWRKAGGLCQKQNIALNKVASTTSGVYGDWNPAKAVDGNNSTYGEGRTCFHAGVSPSDWTVNLGRNFQLYDIRIYSRNGYYGRNANSTIYLNNDPSSICFTLPSPSDTSNPTDVTCNGTGRYVTIRNPGTGSGHNDATTSVKWRLQVIVNPCPGDTSVFYCPSTANSLYVTIRSQGTGGHDGYASALNICEVEIYACSPGIYGVKCNKFCHCLDSTCDRLTGLCPGDCILGWQGQRCDTACYGTNCNKTCAEQKCSSPNSSCDRHTGACDTGCLPGWIQVDCTQECSRGNYGANCTSHCTERQCAGNSSCDHVTGSCDSGCKAGWMGVDCKEVPANCPPGRYGQGCTEFCSSRNCKKPSSVCDVTGSCPDGCREGWQNDDCIIPCQSGKYGSNCSMSCDSRHCETAPVSCDHVTGACAAGCREGWIGADCTQRCKPGTYGPDCTRCGYCDVTCNVGDGRCPGECLDGFTGDRCDEDVRVSPVTSGAIGGAVVLVVMLLLNGGLMMCLLKSGRLKWISSPGTGVRNTDTAGTREIPAHTNTAGTNEQDYTELSEVTRDREKSQYDVIQNKVYENNQI